MKKIFLLIFVITTMSVSVNAMDRYEHEQPSRTPEAEAAAPIQQPDPGNPAHGPISSLESFFEQLPIPETISPLIEQLKQSAMRNPKIAENICRLTYLVNRALELMISEELAKKDDLDCAEFDKEIKPIQDEIDDILNNKLDETTLSKIEKIENEIKKNNPNELTIDTLLVILKSRQKMATLWKELSTKRYVLQLRVIAIKNALTDFLRTKPTLSSSDQILLEKIVPIIHKPYFSIAQELQELIKLVKAFEYIDYKLFQTAVSSSQEEQRVNGPLINDLKKSLISFLPQQAPEILNTRKTELLQTIEEIRTCCTRMHRLHSNIDLEYEYINKNFTDFYQKSFLFRSVYRKINHELFQISPNQENYPYVFILHDLKNDVCEKFFRIVRAISDLSSTVHSQPKIPFCGQEHFLPTEHFYKQILPRIYKTLQETPNLFTDDLFKQSVIRQIIHLELWASRPLFNLKMQISDPGPLLSLLTIPKLLLEQTFIHYLASMQVDSHEKVCRYQQELEALSTTPAPSAVDTHPDKITKKPKSAKDEVSSEEDEAVQKQPKNSRKAAKPLARRTPSPVLSQTKTLKICTTNIRRYLLGADEVEVQGQDYTFINHWNNEEATGSCWIIPNNTENPNQTSYTISQTQSLAPYKSDKFHDVPVAVQRRIKRGLVLNYQNVETFNNEHFSERWKIKSVKPESNKIAIALKAIIVPGHWATNYMGKPERVQNLIRQSTNPPEFVHFGYVIFIFNTQTGNFHHMCFHEEAQSEAVNRTYIERQEFDSENEELVFTTEQAEEQIERSDDGSSAAPAAQAPAKSAAAQEPHRRRRR